MAARKYSWLTAAATAAECPILEGRPGCAESHDAAAHETSSIKRCMFELSLAHGSARLRAGKFRRPGPMARGCRFFRNSSGRNKGRRPRRTPECVAQQKGSVHPDSDGTPHDLCVGARRGTYRHAGDPKDHSECRT